MVTRLEKFIDLASEISDAQQVEGNVEMPELDRKYDISKFKSLGSVPPHLRKVFVLLIEKVSELRKISKRQESLTIIGSDRDEYYKLAEQVKLLESEGESLRLVLRTSLMRPFPISFGQRYVFLPEWQIAIVDKNELREEI